MKSTRTFRAGFLFCGLGAGARGFISSRANLGADDAVFESVGGVDNDPLACADFEYLTGSKSTCADISTMTVADLRAALGEEVPDVVFLSAPCKGFSGLLSSKQAAGAKYQKLNQLALQGLFLAVSAWPTVPGLIVFENVPRIRTRGAGLLGKIRQLLAQHGYVFHESTHECGELGGLGQIRRRYLMVARHPAIVPAYIYRPPRQRVKACGEILSQLPIPGDPGAGELHSLPRISWLNWLRLALIPAGGDWRDLPGMTPKEGRIARAGTHGVVDWDGPAKTVVGESYPSNGSSSVADPRVPLATGDGAHTNIMAVAPWEGPSRTVTGAARPGAGALSVADVRVRELLSPVPDGAERRSVFARHDVGAWSEPSRTVAGSGSNGATNIADPRAQALADAVAVTSGKDWGRENKPHLFGINDWGEPSTTVVGRASVSGGNARAAVADPRAETPIFRGAYGVIDWRAPAGTVRGAERVSQGTVAVADPRLGCEPRAGVYGVLSWQQAAHAITGNARIDNGSFAIGDPRDVPAIIEIKDPKREKPDFIPVIIAEDGTWHRPLTTLELAALQGLPATVNGEPLKLAGRAIGKWRERIGNAVPVQAAQAIAETLLTALLAAALGTWTLGSTGIWVREDGATEEEVNAEAAA